MWLHYCVACCRLIGRIAEALATYQISPAETRKLFLRMQVNKCHLVREGAGGSEREKERIEK